MRAAAVLLLAGCSSARAYQEGVSYLVSSQNTDGSWGSPRGTSGFDVYAPVPGAHDGFRLGTTALCVMALREPSKSGGEPARAWERGLEFLIERGDAKRANPRAIYNIWGHLYALQALAECYRESADPATKDRIHKAAARQIEYLGRYETMYGGWNYYDFGVGAQRPASEPTSFTTAAGLVALHEAKQAGFEVPDRMVERCLRAVRKCAKPDGSYLYDTGWWKYPLHWANRDKGSLGRSQACNFALALYGQSVDSKAGLDRLFQEHRFIEIGRKRQWPHEAWYATSGYYYYFGHYYAARIIAGLEGPEREAYGKRIRDAVLPYQEPDGSWWDYDMYSFDKPYGTAYALLILQLTQ
jgi:hypothetical protein